MKEEEMNIKEIEEYLEGLKVRYESNLVGVKYELENGTLDYCELANGTVEDEAIERAVSDNIDHTEALLRSYVKGSKFKNERIMKYLTLRQLRDLHNDNEKVIILMGKNLSGNKAKIRHEMFLRKPSIFGGR